MSDYDPFQQFYNAFVLAPLRDACIVPPDPNAHLWRYMDFTKFVSMLEKGQLFFARVDKLGDPYEGLLPKANRSGGEAWTQTRRIVFGPEAKVNDSDIEEAAKKNRERIMVSCWHMNDYESAAMWKLYAKSDEAVAIRSTCGKLRSAFDEPPIFISVVQYIDYQRDTITERTNGLFDPIVHKRKSFEHEREVRAITLIDSNETVPTFGLWKELRTGLNLNDLIDEIFVAPESQQWFNDLIVDVTKRYGLNKTVRRSSLDEPY